MQVQYIQKLYLPSKYTTLDSVLKIMYHIFISYTPKRKQSAGYQKEETTRFYIDADNCFRTLSLGRGLGTRGSYSLKTWNTTSLSRGDVSTGSMSAEDIQVSTPVSTRWWRKSSRACRTPIGHGYHVRESVVVTTGMFHQSASEDDVMPNTGLVGLVVVCWQLRSGRQ